MIREEGFEIPLEIPAENKKKMLIYFNTFNVTD